MTIFNAIEKKTKKKYKKENTKKENEKILIKKNKI